MTKLLQFLDKPKNRAWILLPQLILYLILSVFLFINKTCYPQCIVSNNFIILYIGSIIVLVLSFLFISATDNIRILKKIKND